MTYKWKKALASAASIFLGFILAHAETGNDLTLSWSFWKHIFLNAATVTLFAEARYIYTWLSNFNGGNNGTQK